MPSYPSLLSPRTLGHHHCTLFCCPFFINHQRHHHDHFKRLISSTLTEEEDEEEDEDSDKNGHVGADEQDESANVFSSSRFEALSPRQKEQVHRYIDSLLEWNQKMNLTAVKEESEVMERHVEDSLSIIEPIRTSYLSHCGPSSENLNLIDVGSGAGLPGVILAIASPGCKVTLLESMNKHCSFLEHVVSEIGLSNVQLK
ncbi:hypothetical protein K7X08_024486 [Anisodus acutangulus]|uniref:Uncharacterized protein n=1 Tax=Anisodus acutangulus TaxID=402998 RepID=A0A9Q1RG05_9SOLA|nr:hypothetical protein K7X08_024486 [Anisodus acutangulus]